MTIRISGAIPRSLRVFRILLSLQGGDALSKRAGDTFVAKAGSNL